MTEAYYDHMDYMSDSTMQVIEVQNNNPIKVEGLWFSDDNGEKRTPNRVWFGFHFKRYDLNRQNYGGMAYCHYNNALRPVYDRYEQWYRQPQLRDVVCGYKDNVLCNFRRE